MNDGLRELLSRDADPESVRQGVELVLALGDPDVVVEALEELERCVNHEHEWAQYVLLARAGSLSTELRKRAERITGVVCRNADDDIGVLASLSELRQLVLRVRLRDPERLGELRHLESLDVAMISVDDALLAAVRSHPTLQTLDLVDVAETSSLQALRGARLRRVRLMCYDKQIDPAPLGDVEVDELEVSTTLSVGRLGHTNARKVTLRRMLWDGPCMMPRARDVYLNDIRGTLEGLADCVPKLEELTLDGCPDLVHVDGLEKLEHLRELELVRTRASVQVRPDVKVRRIERS